MRAVRLALVGLVILALMAACGSGGLSDDEAAWCAENAHDVRGAFESQGGLDALSEEDHDTYVFLADGSVIAPWGRGEDGAMSLIWTTYRPQYERACRAAYENR